MTGRHGNHRFGASAADAGGSLAIAVASRRSTTPVGHRKGLVTSRQPARTGHITQPAADRSRRVRRPGIRVDLLGSVQAAQSSKISAIRIEPGGTVPHMYRSQAGGSCEIPVIDIGGTSARSQTSIPFDSGPRSVHPLASRSGA